MDYKYIEQLLDRYWKGETSLQEESILRAFFCQSEVPEYLQQYQAWFAAQGEAQKVRLSDDFENRMLKLIDEEQVTARHIGWTRRMAPLYKAAASVAILLTLGLASQQAFQKQTPEEDYNYNSYQDTYEDPQVAYDHMSEALQQVAICINAIQSDDSVAQTQLMAKPAFKP